MSGRRFVGGVGVVGVVAWGHRLQSLETTAQWVARVVPGRSNHPSQMVFTAALTSLVKLYL